MAKTLDLLINANYKGGPAFRKAQGDIDKLEKDSEKAGKAAGASFRGLAAGIGVAGAALGAIAVGAKVAWDTLNEGAALQLTEDRFNKLATSINSTGDALLGKLKEATRGMMSDASLMASATDMISLGLAKTEEQAVRLVTVVGTMGWDMQQVILTFANNSKMRLDALGLSVEEVTRRQQELVAAGMSLDEAFDLAVIEAGEAKMDIMAASTGSATVSLKQFTAALQNANDEFKKTFAQELTDNIASAAGGAESLGENLEYAAEGAAKLFAMLASGPIDALAAVGQTANLGDLSRQFIDLGGNIDEFRRQFPTAFSQGRASAEATAEAIAALESEIVRLEAAAEAANPELNDVYQWSLQMAEGAEEVVTALKDMGDESSDVSGHLAAMAGLAQAAGKKLTGMGKDADAAADSLAGIGERAREGLDEAAVAAEENARRIGEAFQEAALQASGAFADAITGLKDWQIPDLVTPDRDVSWTFGGPSDEQLRIMEEYQQGYDSAAQEVANLQAGIGAFGLEQDDLNKKLETANAEMAYYSGLMAAMALPAEQVGTAHQNLAFNMDMVNQAMYDSGVALGAPVTLLGELGTALYDATGGAQGFTPAMADAAVKAAIFKGALDTLTQQWKLGQLDTSEFMASVQGVVTELETQTVAEIEVKLKQGQNPARELWAHLPAEERVQEMEVEMTPVDAALWAALDTLDAEMEVPRTITMDADYTSVTTAIGTIQADIAAIDGTVPFKADTASTDIATRRLQNTRIDIPVYYVAQNSPPTGSSATGGGSGSGPGRSSWGGKGQFSPAVTINFNGAVNNPNALQRAIRDGMSDFYAAVSREGVAL
jgi:hypothetical protein